MKSSLKNGLQVDEFSLGVTSECIIIARGYFYDASYKIHDSINNNEKKRRRKKITYKRIFYSILGRINISSKNVEGPC